MSNYRFILEKSINKLFINAMRIIFVKPFYGMFFVKTYFWQRKAATLRTYWEENGIHVPPFMIISITNQCNLKCKGCYAKIHRNPASEELGNEKLRDIFNQASELGSSIILIAGGEPLVRKDVLDIIREFKKIIFPVFTNGMLIDSDCIKLFKMHKNIIPIVSLEGYENDTDERRGKGVYKNVQEVIKELNKRNVLFGVSITVTKYNFNTVTDNKFVKELIDAGCNLFFYVEYVPVKEGTEDLIPTANQRTEIVRLTDNMQSQFTSLFFAFPGDEEKFGGCLAAGRGFVHINPEGGLEPCPFAPYSDVSLKDLSLKEALKSDFLTSIRREHIQLNETEGGCALWEKKDWVQNLLKK